MTDALDPTKATDLSKVVARQAAKEKADQDASQRRALAQVQLWDRAMRRTFKGIVSSPVRHAMLNRAGERQDAS